MLAQALGAQHVGDRLVPGVAGRTGGDVNSVQIEGVGEGVAANAPESEADRLVHDRPGDVGLDSAHLEQARDQPLAQ